MNSNVSLQWLKEPRVIDKEPGVRTRIVFMDNCSGHNETPEQVAALAEINATTRKLAANAKHLCKSLDSFVISMIKDAWRREWEAESLVESSMMIGLTALVGLVSCKILESAFFKSRS